MFLTECKTHCITILAPSSVDDDVEGRAETPSSVATVVVRPFDNRRETSFSKVCGDAVEERTGFKIAIVPPCEVRVEWPLHMIALFFRRVLALSSVDVLKNRKQ